MRANRKTILRRLIIGIISFSLIYLFYYHSITTSRTPFVPLVRVRLNRNSSFKKVSIAYYTTTYGSRTDSRSNVFSSELKQICEMLDPEEFPYADGVIVSLVDFVGFPTLSNDKDLYRKKYQSQLWLMHTEESPRNSYRTVKMKNITELDDWFNLTATLKPESDVHIQYKGYRLKTEIGAILQNRFNQTLNSTIAFQFDEFENTTSTYLNTLAPTLTKELHRRQTHHSTRCPYTCNQPLPSNLLALLQPYLKPIIPHALNRKTVYIAWFVSNCDSHSGREEYVLKLRSQPGIHVDIYGDCASLFNSHIVPLQCRKGTPNCMEKTLANYRFYLAFENSKCDTYITEKYWMQGLNGKAVPIVMGAKKEEYRRISIAHSYIHVDDYSTVEQLANELHRLNKNDSEYVKYLQWTQLYDVGEEYTPTAGFDMHSTLCFLGHYHRVHGMKKDNEQRRYLLQRIRDIFDLGKVRVPNFNWKTARTKLVKISEFYNPKVNCWDNDFPSFPRRAWNFLFTWWKLF